MKAFENWLMDLSWTQFWLLVTGAFTVPAALLWAWDMIAERRAWRRASAVIKATEDGTLLPGEIDPVEAAADEILAITCPWCPDRRGECTCPQRCHTPGCQGEWTTTLHLFTLDDRRWLRSLKIGDHQ